MFRSILVPLDGSLFAEHALPLALGIASRAGARLRLVQVHVPYGLMNLDGMAPFAVELDARALARERAYLAEVAERSKKVTPCPVDAASLEGCNPVEALAEYAAREGVDLVVMTTHGRGPLTRSWLGSVADGLLRRATVPVLLLRPREQAPELGQAPVIRHILVALDGSPLAEEVLGPALALGALLRSRYTLLRVIDPRFSEGSSPPPAERLEAEAYLGGVAARLRQRGAEVRTAVAGGRPAAAAILREADLQSADLVALATHGHGRVGRLLLGSCADKVIRGATRPVLVQPPSGTARWAGATFAQPAEPAR